MATSEASSEVKSKEKKTRAFQPLLKLSSNFISQRFVGGLPKVRRDLLEDTLE
jgi:F0F1-type ATP synthase assembly protein I